MSKAPVISSIIAVALIPVALLYIHSFVAAIKKWKYHNLTGLLAIVGDLSISLGYMLYRTLGGSMNGSSIDLTGNTLLYFMIHGIVSLIVIILEISVLISAIYKVKKKSMSILHCKLGKVLFIIWWFAFLSGEIFYIINYVI